MQAYLLRRVAQSVLTLVGMSVLVFVILRVLPGDPAKMLLPEGAPQSAVDELNRHLGLKEPLHVQYGIFLRSVFQGDFGQSFQYRAPALLVVRERLPATLRTTLCAMVLTVVSGVAIGIVAAVRARHALRLRGTLLAVPRPVAAELLARHHAGPAVRGHATVAAHLGFQNWTYLVLPSITLAAYPTALVARLTRSSMLEILSRDYIRTGRAKGLAERAVILRHALRNATIPVLTVIGLQIGTLLGGAVITESVFAWPGMGSSSSMRSTSGTSPSYRPSSSSRPRSSS